MLLSVGLNIMWEVLLSVYSLGLESIFSTWPPSLVLWDAPKQLTATLEISVVHVLKLIHPWSDFSFLACFISLFFFA